MRTQNHLTARCTALSSRKIARIELIRYFNSRATLLDFEVVKYGVTLNRLKYRLTLDS